MSRTHLVLLSLISELTVEESLSIFKRKEIARLPCPICNRHCRSYVQQAGLDIYGNKIENGDANGELVACSICKKSVAASRFAPHLEKCMGMGRSARMKRTATIKSSKNGTSELIIDDQPPLITQTEIVPPTKKRKRKSQKHGPVVPLVNASPNRAVSYIDPSKLLDNETDHFISIEKMEHILDKENNIQCRTPLLKQNSNLISAKRNTTNAKRNLNSILTPQNTRTPGNALRDITNSTQILNNITTVRPSFENTKTPLASRSIDNIEDILALSDSELPDVEYIPNEPVHEKIETFDFLLDLAAINNETKEADSANLQDEINQFIWPNTSVEEEYSWAFQKINYLEDELRPCFMFDDISPTVTVITVS